MILLLICLVLIAIMLIVLTIKKVRESKHKMNQKNVDYRLYKWLFLWLLTHSKSTTKMDMFELISKLIKKHFNLNDSIESLKMEYTKYDNIANENIEKYIGFEVEMLDMAKKYSEVRYSIVDKDTIIKSLVAIAMFDNELDVGEQAFISKVCDTLGYDIERFKKVLNEVYEGLIKIN